MHRQPFLLLALLYCFTTQLAAQFVAPPASPPARTEVTVGYTPISIDYHRPNVRGRKVFGELVPWREVWRAGANQNTVITFGGPVMIGDTMVPAGTYALFVLPNETGRWAWILNEVTDGWGARNYNQNKDLLRFRTDPERLPAREETFGYRFRNLGPDGVELTLEWEWYRLSLPIQVATDAAVAERAEKHLNPAADPKEYYAAARYYLDNDLDLKQAKQWMDRWAAEDEEQFGRMRYQAIIEHRLGNDAAADRLMRRSLELARTAGNDHYVRMNERSLREWSRTAVELPADTLLARSIRYHDPTGAWGSTVHRLQLAESRPGGSTRHTRLSLFPGEVDFDLTQTRGRDKIQLRRNGATYSFSHQGRTNIPAEDRERLNLTPERVDLLRDYYTYLFGLPMKLRDAGTRIDPTVHTVWFNDAEVYELRVEYSPDKGDDVWFFYFDPETYALTGYAFYHKKDGPGTGEYIILDGEALVDKMRLPAERHWYYTHNNLYLGTDEILR